MPSLHIRSSKAGLLDNKNTYYLLNACFTSLSISLNVSVIRIPAFFLKNCFFDQTFFVKESLLRKPFSVKPFSLEKGFIITTASSSP